MFYGLVLASAAVYLIVQFMDPRSRLGRFSSLVWMAAAILIVFLRLGLGDTALTMVLMALVALLALGTCSYLDWQAHRQGETTPMMFRVMIIGAAVGGLLTFGLILTGEIEM